MRATLLAAALMVCASHANAQIPPVLHPASADDPPASSLSISQRGFVEGVGIGFFQTAPNDPTRLVGDVLLREDVFFKPTKWLEFAAGGDLRANSHDQVEDKWRVDFRDRGILRPRASVRRLTATIAAGHFTLDLGKQFIRWGRADIVNPTDRFAPRDYVNLLDSELIPVLGVRPSIRFGAETLEGVWLPRLTPSRLPLLDQRWAALPPAAAGIPIQDDGSNFPQRSELGVRWSHTGGRIEGSLSYFHGSNHLPIVDVLPLPNLTGVELIRDYPALHTYGGDVAIPTSVLTLKGEAAYFQFPGLEDDDHVLYVLEAERQTGDWLLDAGYAGDVVTQTRRPSPLFLASVPFVPDRGLARSIVGRASYTVDPRRTVTIEGAARQSGDGFYAKGEYSEAFGQHWRLTLTGVGIGGTDNDFLGQYRRNSHASAALRFSF